MYDVNWINDDAMPKIAGLDFVLLSDATYGVKAGDNIEDITSITIPETYNGIAVTKILSDGFIGLTSLQAVKISDSITEIEECAFRDCTNLTNVDLGNGVIIIGEGAFYNSGIKNITIPTSVKNIEIYAFMTATLSEVTFEVATDWYTVWDGTQRTLEYTFEDAEIAAIHLANENHPFYHD